MKNLIVIVMCAAALTACKKTSNSSYTPDCSGAAKSYASNVAPLMSSKCVSCHSSYNSYSGVNSDKAGIRSSIVSGSMPKSNSMTDAEKNSVVCWIDSGAPNN
jgi:uncharacterized membrane protein